MYNVLIKISNLTGKLSLGLEYQGFDKRDLGDLGPLRSVTYMGDGQLRTGPTVAKTLEGSFGYLYGFDEKGCLLIYRDRLGTFPLFMFNDKKNKQLILFNKFYLIKEYWPEFTLDETGFWELAFFECTLKSRSLFSNVSQIPSASYIKIKPDLEHSINRYWHFNYEKKTNLSKNDFLEQSFERFDRVFAGLNKEKHYLLPVSGGVDSRMTAAFMAKHLPKDHIHSMTYGYDSRSLEYTYAKKVTSALDLKPPVFHTLNASNYIRNLKPLAEITGGGIAIHNCHLFDYVNKVLNNADPYTICSTAFSDGVLGFDSKKDNEKTDSFQDSSFLNLLKYFDRELSLPPAVSGTIKSSLLEEFTDWKDLSSITSFKEYLYLFERNNKFHLLYADMLRDFHNVTLPFTDPSVTDFYFSCSNEFRYCKLATIDMMNTFFPSLRNIKTIGSLFGREGMKRPYRFSHFKLLNFSNYISARYLNDSIHFINPYQTEIHGYNLRKYQREYLKKAVDFLYANAVISGSVADRLNAVPARNASEFTLRYQILNAAYVIALFKGQTLFGSL